MIKHYAPYRSDFYTAHKVPRLNIMQDSWLKGTEINYFAEIYGIFAVRIYVFTERE